MNLRLGFLLAIFLGMLYFVSGSLTITSNSPTAITMQITDSDTGGTTTTAINKYRIVQHNVFSILPPFVHTISDIYLEDEIYSNDYYSDISKVLVEAKLGDIVRFHLSGYGGEVDTVLTLADQIKESKAVVNMIVEGPVYSGHAYLALSGTTLKMSDNTFLMLHYSTVLDVNCSLVKGLDRGQPLKDHCEQNKEEEIKIFNNYLNSLPFLTAQEIQTLQNGGQVYLFPEDIRNRGGDK